jgi:glucosamine--fructose-6-phosphate aminotransferase (isomerizing)
VIDAASRSSTQMGREIGQIPAAVQRVLDEPAQLAEVAAAIERAGPRWIMIAGRGTSDHAAVFAQYLFETHLGLPTGLVKPSVTTVYGASLDWRGGMVLAISQSGQSPDVVAVVEAARQSGALTVAITNEPASPLAAAAEQNLRIHAGRELAVPATKTYVTELAVLAALANAVRPTTTLADGLAALPSALQDTIVRTRVPLQAVRRRARSSGAARAPARESRGPHRPRPATRGRPGRADSNHAAAARAFPPWAGTRPAPWRRAP